jgi:glycosyltransferase involved in cell wall biosynthesis
MNIAIESFSLSLEKITGIGNVTLNYLKELEKLDATNNYFIYTLDDLLHFTITNPRWTHVVYDWKIKHVLNRYAALYGQIKTGALTPPAARVVYIRLAKMALEAINWTCLYLWLARSLRKNGIGVYLGIFADFFPLYFLSRVRKIWLIHDIVWKLFPETVKTNRHVMSYKIRRGIRKADLLLSVSDSTKQDIVDILKTRTDIITVHNAADRSKFFPADGGSTARVKKKYGITKKYILSVCTIEPRKNLVTLMRAYEKMGRGEQCQLVLVGMSGWKNTPLFSMMEKYEGRNSIIVTGYVPAEDLAPLYTGAEVFVFPTLYEGFGLPVLEAMQCGCPVISSSIPSIREVAGDACILVPPLDDTTLASEMESLIGDPGRKASMKKKGIARAALFSWEKSARTLIDIFNS